MTILHTDINNLPDELLVHIFKCLPLEDVLSCADVCIRWKALAQDSAVWRSIVVTYNARQNKYRLPKTTLKLIHSYADLIRCIKLQTVDDYATMVRITKRCSNLESLELIMCRLTRRLVFYITRWPKLKKISFRNCYTGDLNELNFLIQYDHFKELNYLALSDFGVSSPNCNTLLQCQNLTHILLEKIKGLQKNFIQDLVVAQQNILVTFHIYGGNAIDDDCLELISQCSRLQDLGIVRCENLTDKGLVKLPNLRKIKHLQIWNNDNFSEKALLLTLGSPSMINLQSLSFSRILNVSPVVVDLISEHYKNLKHLDLYQCPKIINTDYEKQLKSKFRNIDVVLY